MKRNVLVVFMLTAVMVAAFAQTGIIREMTGTVELKHAGSSAFVTASSGDNVPQNTVISTGFRSTAVVVVGSSVLTVRPLTRLTLAEIQSAEKDENVKVNLQAGRVRVEVKPPAGTKSTFSVQSPSATASVRGTSFEFDTRSVTVREGTVSFSGKSGTIPTMVNAGGESYVLANGAAADPIEIAVAAIIPAPPVGIPEAETMTDAAPATTGDLAIGITWSGSN